MHKALVQTEREDAGDVMYGVALSFGFPPTFYRLAERRLTARKPDSREVVGSLMLLKSLHCHQERIEWEKCLVSRIDC